MSEPVRYYLVELGGTWAEVAAPYPSMLRGFDKICEFFDLHTMHKAWHACQDCGATPSLQDGFIRWEDS